MKPAAYERDITERIKVAEDAEAIDDENVGHASVRIADARVPEPMLAGPLLNRREMAWRRLVRCDNQPQARFADARVGQGRQ